MFEISVTRTFCAAHALRLPDGSREPLHGHNWTVTVTVAADALDPIDTVMDFHELEQLVEAAIAPWHNATLEQRPPFAGPPGAATPNSTAERVAQHLGVTVAAQLPPRVRLLAAAVTEAPGCIATWRPA